MRFDLAEGAPYEAALLGRLSVRAFEEEGTWHIVGGHIGKTLCYLNDQPSTTLTLEELQTRPTCSQCLGELWNTRETVSTGTYGVAKFTQKYGRAAIAVLGVLRQPLDTEPGWLEAHLDAPKTRYDGSYWEHGGRPAPTWRTHPDRILGLLDDTDAQLERLDEHLPQLHAHLAEDVLEPVIKLAEARALSLRARRSALRDALRREDVCRTARIQAMANVLGEERVGPLVARATPPPASLEDELGLDTTPTLLLSVVDPEHRMIATCHHIASSPEGELYRLPRYAADMLLARRNRAAHDRTQSTSAVIEGEEIDDETAALGLSLWQRGQGLAGCMRDAWAATRQEP